MESQKSLQVCAIVKWFLHSSTNLRCPCPSHIVKNSQCLIWECAHVGFLIFCKPPMIIWFGFMTFVDIEQLVCMINFSNDMDDYENQKNYTLVPTNAYANYQHNGPMRNCSWHLFCRRWNIHGGIHVNTIWCIPHQP